MNNALIEHIRQLNIRERAEHDAKKQKAIARIKELRQRIRREQEASAHKNTVGNIS